MYCTHRMHQKVHPILIYPENKIIINILIIIKETIIIIRLTNDDLVINFSSMSKNRSSFLAYKTLQLTRQIAMDNQFLLSP